MKRKNSLDVFLSNYTEEFPPIWQPFFYEQRTSIFCEQGTTMDYAPKYL